MDAFALGRVSSTAEGSVITSVDYCHIRQCFAAIVENKDSSSCSLLLVLLDDSSVQERRLEWFIDEGARAACLSFTKQGDELVVIDVSLNNVFRLKLEKHRVKRIRASQIHRQQIRSSSHINKNVALCCRCWSPSVSSQSQEDGDEVHNGNCDEKKSVVFVGTEAGQVVLIDVSSGKEIRTVKISDHPVHHLRLLKDSMGDATYLLVSDSKRCQWRLLVEQRSSAYVILESSPKSVGTSDQSSSGSKQGHRSFRPMSGFLSWGQRLSETSRRILDRRLSSMSSASSMSSGSTSSLVIDNDLNDHTVRRLSLGGVSIEPLRRRVGNTFVDVQIHAERQIHTNELRCHDVVTGLFVESAVLTLHNGELEVLSQSAFKMPRAVSKVLVQQATIIAICDNQNRRVNNGSSNRAQIHVLCRSLAEIHSDNGLNGMAENGSKREPLIQSFGLGENEEILALYETTATTTALEQNQTKEESEQLVTEDKEQVSECQHNFRQEVASDLEAIRNKSKKTSKPCLIVTTKALYLLYLQRDPIDVFLVHADPTINSKMSHCEKLAKALQVDIKSHLQVVNNKLLIERQFTRCVALSRYCGLSHLSLVLRLAQSGCVAQILSYVDILFRSSNVELNDRDKMHCSNLALMACFHQLLAKKTRMERQSFLNKIVKPFLEANQWFDADIAVQLCVKNNEWQALNHVTRQRGVARQGFTMAIEALLPQHNKIDHDVALRHIRHSRALLKAIFGRDALVNILDEPELRERFVYSLICLRPLLNQREVLRVIKSLSFVNCNLDPFLVSLLMKPTERRAQRAKSYEHLSLFGRELLSLTIDFGLSLVQRTKDQSFLSDMCQEQSIVPSMLLSESFECQSSEERNCKYETSSFLGAGLTHGVRVNRRGRVMTWGTNLQGVLGSDCPSRHYSRPLMLPYFKSLRLRVVSVAVGKQHNLALTQVGTLYAWGSNKNGQLGIASRMKMQVRPAQVAIKHRIVAVAAGQFHSLAIDEKGSLFTWGWGVHGQLGHGLIEDELRPRRVQGFGRDDVGFKLDESQNEDNDVNNDFSKRSNNVIAATVVAGYSHSLVVTEEGAVYAFGCGLFGQMGNGLKIKLSRPRRVEKIDEPVKMIAAGFFHNIVVTESNKVFTWGCNPQLLRLEAQVAKRRRLQLQQQGEKRARTALESLSSAKTTNNNDLFRKSHSLLRDLKRQVKQALEDMEQGGHIANGQVPNSDETAIDALACIPDSNNEVEENGKEVKNTVTTTPPITTNTTSIPNSTTIEEGQRHLHPSLLPLGALDTRWVSNIASISCGNQHTLFLMNNGQVFAQGRSMDGQLGVGDRKERCVPTLVSALNRTHIDAIVCGADFSLAVNNEEGLIFGFGNNATGQLGRQPEAEPSSKNVSTTGNGEKSVMMRTTRQIIRLQNNLHNTCDTPRAITVDKVGGVYPEQRLDSEDDKEEEEEFEAEDKLLLKKERNIYDQLERLRATFTSLLRFSENSESELPELIMQLTLEMFYDHLDLEATVAKCLENNRRDLACKLCLLCNDSLKAFELSLEQFQHDQKMQKYFEKGIFNIYKFYLSKTEDRSLRCRLTQRLIQLWQERQFDFAKLESCFNDTDEVATRSLVETLFVNDNRDSNNNDYSDKMLSNLFSPEFCLETSDRFVTSLDEEESSDFLRHTANSKNVYKAGFSAEAITAAHSVTLD